MSGRHDNRGRRSKREGRWRRKECDEIVCYETPVGMRDGELAWARGGPVDNCGYVDIKGSEALCSRIEQTVGRKDLKKQMLTLFLLYSS